MPRAATYRLLLPSCCLLRFRLAAARAAPPILRHELSRSWLLRLLAPPAYPPPHHTDYYYTPTLPCYGPTWIPHHHTA